MKIFLIGGTGLIGCAAAEELINCGHEVRAIALPPMPEGLELPPQLAFDFKDYRKLNDDELRGWFYECEGFVFAEEIDEKTSCNVDPLERILMIAKECGVRRAVICGSYYSYFDKKWPHMELARRHPYIQSLRDQEKLALSFAGDNFNVAVLQFPYVFGVQMGLKPVWTNIVNTVRKMPFVTLYPKGGTTMITKKQAAQAIAGALERSEGGKCWPIGCYNIPWREFLPVVHDSMGMKGKPVITIPNWPINLYLKWKDKKQKKLQESEASGASGASAVCTAEEKLENFINSPDFFKFHSADTYIDRTYGIIPLGVDDDDITKEIGESIRYTVEWLDGKTASTDSVNETVAEEAAEIIIDTVAEDKKNTGAFAESEEN